MNPTDTLRLLRRRLQSVIGEIDACIGPDIANETVYAVGIKEGNSFGMMAGPLPTLGQMLEFVPGEEDLKGPLHLLECKSGPSGESMMQTIRVWDTFENEWRDPTPEEVE